MKQKIRKLVSISLLHRYRRIKRLWDQRADIHRTTEDVFTELYRKNKWGGAQGEFYSGPGSTEKHIISPYIEMITDKVYSEACVGRSFVDLGCGDFNVGSQLIPLCSSYVGVDIVKPLVQRNQEKYGNEAIHFMHLDIVKNELPDGDVCFVRQVLQHLSNQQIMTVLQKLTKYQWVFITEHYPTQNNDIDHNIDKVHGASIRLNKNSGVYLTELPFSLPTNTLEQVLEVPGTSSGEGNDAGVIRTFLYKPRVRLA
jgi:SAM-dependent methyltransferase